MRPRLPCRRSFATFLFLLFIPWQTALANTEIENFSVYEQNETAIPRTKAWPILCQAQNEGQWKVQPAPLNSVLKDVGEAGAGWKSGCTTSIEDDYPPCPHELWVTLDFSGDQWEPYSKFTLRLSWPAFYPTDFSMQIYGPDEFLRCSSKPEGSDEPPARFRKSRRKYARIRLVDTGILTPTRDMTSPRSAEAVPFNLILEPLYFGILPASVLPIVFFLVPVVVVAGLMVPLINAYLEGIVLVVRQETSTSRAKAE